MKKIIISLFFSFALLWAEPIHFTDIFDAYDVAKEQNMPVFVMLSKKACPGCKVMHDVVLKDEALSKFINANFIMVEIDVYDESVPDELEYFATPTLYFLDKDEHILKRINGGQKAPELLKTLKSVAQMSKK